MTSSSSSETLFRAQDDAQLATGAATHGLSADILSRSARRLRILALMYTFTFFMAGFLPSLLFEADRARMLATFVYWVPDLIAIAMALVVAAFTLIERVPVPVVLNVGLAFLVVSSYGDRDRRVHRSRAARQQRMDRPVLGRRLDAALHRRGADTTEQSAAGHAGIRERGPDRDRMDGRHRAARRSSRDHGSSSFAIVFPYLLVVVLAYARPARRVCARQGSHACAGAWAAIGWSSGSATAAWAKCGAPGIGCSRAPRRSS